MTRCATIDGETPLSAQVVLRGHDRSPTASAKITSATLDEYRPEPKAADTVRRVFQERGFDVGEIVGNSFSISGASALFQDTFGTKFHRTPKGGIVAGLDSEHSTENLPLTHLPERARREVIAVTFTVPPDFGPTEMSP